MPLTRIFPWIIQLILVALGVALLCRPAIAGPIKPIQVWIDTDPACGRYFWQDVDDCFAIAQALRDPRLEVLGITTSFGNSLGLTPYNIAKEWVERLGKRTPVYLGYQRPFRSEYDVSQISRVNSVPDAVSILAKTLMDAPDRIVIVALGPLTNIAATLHIYPELLPKVQAVVMLGGLTSEDGYWTAPAGMLSMRDYNVSLDPVAVSVLLNMTVNLTFIPVKAAFPYVLTDADLDSLRADKALSWLADQSSGWMRLWTAAFGLDGFPPFDSLAVMRLTHPQLFTCREVSAVMVERSRLFGDGTVLEHHAGPKTSAAVLNLGSPSSGLGFSARQRCIINNNIKPTTQSDTTNSQPSNAAKKPPAGGSANTFPAWKDLLRASTQRTSKAP